MKTKKSENNTSVAGRLLPIIKVSKPETRNPKPETRNSKPGTRNPKPETRNPKSETRNPKPETRNPKPETLSITESGYYGEYGGAYIPEILYANVESLKNSYKKILNDPTFQDEFQSLLSDYAGRPSPLYHAKRLSEKYGCKIYLKREDLNHTGSHKINNALGQILLARRMNKTRIIAETGAGQHGVATATVCALMNMECIVYMGATDVERQKLNVRKMEMLGAKVVPVLSGSKTLKDATNEAIRDWCCNPADTHYIIGSTVGPHPYPDLVARLQSVISKEIKKQLQEKENRDYPDYLLACVGGGSNAAGTMYEYIDDLRVKIVLAEAAGKGIDSGESAATIQLGTVGIIHGAKTLLMQTDDGQIVEPYSISAGLDYPGIGPMHAHLARTGRSEVLAIDDQEALAAAMELTRLEGIIPALESAHALGIFGKKLFKTDDIVVLCLSGRGDKDMETYMQL
jgi:tryptophan synthase beta chain